MSHHEQLLARESARRMNDLQARIREIEREVITNFRERSYR